MERRQAPPPQQMLPLEPPAPPAAAVEAEVRRLWKSRPYWRARYQSLDAALADPQRAALLRTCARQALVQRARDWLQTTKT